MAAWPQNSIRPGAVLGHLRPSRTTVAKRKAGAAAGWPPRRIDRDGWGPVREQARIAPSNAGCRPQVPDTGRRSRETPFGRCFGPIRAHLFMKSDFPGGLRTVSGLLHSRSAFGIALPLTASDRRHLGCGCSSVVEHDLAKVGVEGSSPFARSRFFQMAKHWIQPTGRLLAAASFVRPRQADAAEGSSHDRQPLTWGCDRPRSSPCPSSRWETDR